MNKSVTSQETRRKCLKVVERIKESKWRISCKSTWIKQLSNAGYSDELARILFHFESENNMKINVTHQEMHAYMKEYHLWMLAESVS